MDPTFGSLVRKRFEVDTQILGVLRPQWAAIQEAVGVLSDLRSVEPPRAFFCDDGIFDLPVQVRTKSWRDSAPKVWGNVVRVPVDCIDASDPEATRQALVRVLPLGCDRCGLRHPVGTERCSSKDCGGRLLWLGSHRPRYFHGEHGRRGWNTRVDRPIRYCIDLATSEWFGLEVFQYDRWTGGAEVYRADYRDRVEETVGQDVLAAVAGRPTYWAWAHQLSDDLPDWCHASTHREPIRLCEPIAAEQAG